MGNGLQKIRKVRRVPSTHIGSTASKAARARARGHRDKTFGKSEPHL